MPSLSLPNRWSTKKWTSVARGRGGGADTITAPLLSTGLSMQMSGLLVTLTTTAMSKPKERDYVNCNKIPKQKGLVNCALIISFGKIS